VHPDFWSKQEKASAREELGLKNMPTALVMGGGWGLLLREELLDKLAAWREDIQVVCCTGSNEKLAARLRAHPTFHHPNMKVIGFTRQIGKWMDASDLLITKPGGMTCTEGMAKGIPMLFFESIPGQEEKNREYFVQHGYGAELTSPDVLDEWFDNIRHQHASNLQPWPEPPLQHPGYQPERCAEAVLHLLYQAAAPVRIRLQTASPAEQQAN